MHSMPMSTNRRGAKASLSSEPVAKPCCVCMHATEEDVLRVDEKEEELVQGACVRV